MPPANPPPEDPAERKARHLAMLRDLAELGMNLARKAAEKADEDLERDDTQAQPGKPDHNLTFNRHARAVRDTIALESRIASDTPSRRAPPYRPAASSDPRRPLLRRALHQAAHAEPDRAQLCRAIDERIEQELLADPAQDTPAGSVLAAISRHLDLSIDPSKLSDELLVCDHPGWNEPPPEPPDRNSRPAARRPDDPPPDRYPPARSLTGAPDG